ncbi:hypothetical protein AAK899_08275 [Erysipelotrichaceae bacterium 51-3]
MTTKKAIEKFINHNDVFANIVNVLLFKESDEIHPEDLQDVDYDLNGKILQNAAHIAKRSLNATLQIHCIGFDSLTEEDAYLPMEVYCDLTDLMASHGG